VKSVNKHQKEPFPAELQFAFVRMSWSCVHTGRNANRKGRCLQAKDGGFVAAAPVTNAYHTIRGERPKPPSAEAAAWAQTNKIFTWKITNVKSSIRKKLCRV